MQKRIVTVLGLFLAAAALLPSCTKNEDTTIVPIGEEGYVEDIFTVVSDLAFWADFGSCPQGAIPPDIQGKYLVARKKGVATNMPGLQLNVPFWEPNMEVRFVTQHNGLAVMELTEATETLTDTVVVMGNGKSFTAYCIEDKHIEEPFQGGTYHVDMRRGIVIKGTISEAGIANFRMGTIILSESNDSHGAILPHSEGDYCIYEDEDGLAERME